MQRSKPRLICRSLEGTTPWALIMQRRDLHRSSTTEMPIVGTNKQTIFKHKTMIFSSKFFDLKLRFFHPNIGEKKRFDIGNITVKRPKISTAYRLLSQYMKQTIIMSSMELGKVTHILFKPRDITVKSFRI